VSLHRRAARRDQVEPAIVAALAQCGWQVMRLSIPGAPDLLCCRAGVIVLCEVKARTGKLTKDQREWHAWWKGPPPVILRTVDDVIALTHRER
jgi:hypothetical protein